MMGWVTATVVRQAARESMDRSWKQSPEGSHRNHSIVEGFLAELGVRGTPVAPCREDVCGCGGS